VRVWRLLKRRRLNVAFSGEGARIAGGRWNSPGLSLVYASQTLALATLEYLVHASLLLAPPDVWSIWADIPDTLTIETIRISQLPARWRRYDPPPDALRKLGDDWIRRAKTAILQVPSAAVPSENNFLLNPAHRDFARIKIGKAARVPLDPRLFR
jgi:RES domain-containing protein